MLLQQKDVQDVLGSLENTTLKISVSQTSSGNSNSSSSSSSGGSNGNSSSNSTSGSSSSSRGEKPGRHKNCEETRSKFLHANVLGCAREQDFPSASTHMYFPTLSSIKAGRPPRPTECPASGKMQGQWEISLSVHPHDFPTTTLAVEMAAHAQAPVQAKEEAPRANLGASPSPAVPPQHEAYDLMADFPALKPPKRERLLNAMRDGNTKTRPGDGRRGIFYMPNHYHHKPSYQRRIQSVPREVSSICAGVQKISLDLQPFGSSGQLHSRSIGREELRANNHPPPEGNKSAACLRQAALFRGLSPTSVGIKKNHPGNAVKLFYVVF